MQWILHSTSRAHSQVFMMCLSYKTRNSGEKNPQKTTLKFKVMTSNSQWDWYYLWRTMRWHRGAVRNTQRSHSPGAARITLRCCGGEHKRSTRRGRWGVSCWSSPASLLCCFIPPRAVTVGPETKATLSQLWSAKQLLQAAAAVCC